MGWNLLLNGQKSETIAIRRNERRVPDSAQIPVTRQAGCNEKVVLDWNTRIRADLIDQSADLVDVVLSGVRLKDTQSCEDKSTKRSSTTGLTLGLLPSWCMRSGQSDETNSSNAYGARRGLAR